MSLWASEAHWEVFLSALEQLFRQLVSRRTVQLSSYQLLTPLLPSPIPVLSDSFSLSPSLLLFTDLFPEGFLTDVDGGFTGTGSDKCAPHVLIIISALPFVVIYALLNASPGAKRSGGGVGSCLNSSSMPVID